MQKTILTIVLAVLCLNFNSKAQNQQDKIQPLKIGDTIPEAIWNMPLQVINHPEGKKTITLSDYKDKLIILDFWATYCKPCIRSIQKLDSIKKDFKDEFIVIPVQVYDKEDQVVPFLKKKGLNWHSVVNDTLLNRVVLSRYLTGFGTAWIYKNRLVAVPVPPSITKQNILKLLAGIKPEITNLQEQVQ